MGVRDPNWKGEGRAPFIYKDFKWGINKAKNFGAGLEHLGLCPEINEFRDYKTKFISIFAPNVENLYIIDLAIMMYGYTLAPLYNTLGPDTLSYVLN